MTSGWHEAAGSRGRARFKSAEDGAVAAEFAFVVAPFLLLLTGLIELGFMLHAEAGLQNATDEAGRLIRTGQVTSRTGNILMSASTFIEKVCARATDIPNCANAVSIDVQSQPNFTDLSSSMPDPITVGPETLGGDPVITFTPGGASRSTSVIVTFDWNFRLPFMKPFGNVFSGSARRLQAITIFRNEPF